MTRYLSLPDLLRFAATALGEEPGVTGDGGPCGLVTHRRYPGPRD
ncbi:hypothetical protein Ae168Ps1_1680c [Pseudonocardia sp. Ae168_Ps1]|nr:hypothetical protein Ae150APs1_1673c [Pseudonocardia sp. Ae150A_Ps1]OLL79274.1 hypothetical protein Ae168Ps1_1680c [Pseudonocardia sp. Ae168_Ps1]OLL86588.1 hypothetical protein Ae263Ps1_3643 [Pseudonocardia sp. Ae263_Ps1]OLL93364.1 hypothetical protein Ae356Ps1_3261c [Pseudonocardia sp. Ae356_Ps1]